MTFIRSSTRRGAKPAAGIKRPHYYRIDLLLIVRRVESYVGNDIQPLEMNGPAQDKAGWETECVNPWLKAAGFQLLDSWYKTTHQSDTLVETRARGIHAKHELSGNLYEIIYLDED